MFDFAIRALPAEWRARRLEYRAYTIEFLNIAAGSSVNEDEVAITGNEDFLAVVVMFGHVIAGALNVLEVQATDVAYNLELNGRRLFQSRIREEEFTTDAATPLILADPVPMPHGTLIRAEYETIATGAITSARVMVHGIGVI